MKLVIGLTGGIGSGKSTAAKLFAELGATIIDADVIARMFTSPEHPAFQEIVQYFGHSILSKDGHLNRAKLRQIIFSKPEAKLWLENLLHPLIIQEITRQIDLVQGAYCIVVIPLLFESNKPFPFINRVLAIDSPVAMQIQRVTRRDAVTSAEVEAIIETQARPDQRFSVADDIILNDGDLSGLKRQVKQLHEKYLLLSQS